jgi:fermentation-respiration switch protein FrsA (DUF1100 family)
MHRKPLIIPIPLCLALMLAGCDRQPMRALSTPALVAQPTTTPVSPARAQAEATRSPSPTQADTATPVPEPSPTPTPLVEATPSPTATSTRTSPQAVAPGGGLDTRTDAGTATPSVGPSATEAPPLRPTMTPTALHPLMIEVMRRQTYPGSDIVIEQTLDAGPNYDRYIASYLSEGLKIYALLTVPRGERPQGGWPFIVFNHGHIPPDQYRTTERYVAYVDGFARRGYIVFRPDYRGHGNSEGQPADAYTAPDYTVDVLNAVASLQRYPDADPDRVGMWGHSMGGTLALRAMVVSDEIDAGVIWAGVVAPIEEVWEKRRRWIENDLIVTPDPDGTPGPPIEGVFAYGWFDQNPEFWASVDPTFHIEDLSGPLQLHHGTGDETVPVEFSEDLYTRLQESGRRAELHLYQGDNHNIANQFATAMERSIQFFDTYLMSTG